MTYATVEEVTEAHRRVAPLGWFGGGGEGWRFAWWVPLGLLYHRAVTYTWDEGYAATSGHTLGTSSGPYDHPVLQHCVEHEDCRTMAELARACWESTRGAP